MKFAKEAIMSKLEELKDQIKEVKEKTKILKAENSKLKDELESLWSMMDELKSADIKNWSHLVKNLQKDIMEKTLMTTTKKADC